MRRCLPWCLTLALIATGCAGAPASRSERTTPPPPPVAAAPASAPATAPTGTARTVTRTAVLDVLDHGIPWFLRQIDTEPELDGGRFVGFKLRAFFASDPRFRRVDLAPGDVVLRINGLPIERPEHAYRIWQELRVASEIRVESLRNGQPHEIEYTIVDG